MRRLFRFLGVLTVVFAAIAALLYAFGARFVLDGGGGVHVRFVESSNARARIVEQHREAQRAQAGATVDAPAAAGTAPSPAAATPDATAGAAPVPAAARSSLALPGVVLPNDWNDFRGPARDGRYRGVATLTAWPAAGLAPLWKQPIGEGYASFVVTNGRAFTIEQRGPREVVAAYDVATGREIWTHGWTAAFREIMGGDGPRATPAVADGVVYALGGAGEFRALDAATGRQLWRTNILDDAGAANLQWGMAAAPLVVDHTVVVLPGGSGGRSVVAYNRTTGARVWSALDDRAAYASPMLVTLGGVRQILVFTASRLIGLMPDGSALLWEYPWRTQYDVNAAQPIVIDDRRIFLSSGYGTGAAVIELTRAGDRFDVREVWRNIRMKNQFNSSVLHDGHIYGLDESILACVDAGTGELKWKGGRYGYGQVILAGDRLIVLTEGGDLVLVRATPERHDELARFPAIEGKTWNHPALAGGVLLVRNVREMAAFDLRQR